MDFLGRAVWAEAGDSFRGYEFLLSTRGIPNGIAAPSAVAPGWLEPAPKGDVRDERWLVAEEFKGLGVLVSTPVAATYYQQGYEYWPPALISDWARLARVRVVREVATQLGDKAQFWWVPP